VNQAKADSAVFTSTRLTLWQRIHTIRLARESSTDPDAISLEQDFRTCMAEIFPMPYPSTCSSTLDRIWNLCCVQQGLLFQDCYLPDRFSHYYDDIYSGAYSTLETVMSAAEEKSATLRQAEQTDEMALHSVDDLMKVVMQ
jgi:hypothetical protein